MLFTAIAINIELNYRYNSKFTYPGLKLPSASDCVAIFSRELPPLRNFGVRYRTSARELIQVAAYFLRRTMVLDWMLVCK